MSKPTTGRSKRTPAKHSLMSKLFGREVGAAHSHPKISDLVWLDLTAGDGVPSEQDRGWHESCSPGLLAYHARFPRGRMGPPRAFKPVTVVLHERQARTYALLLDNLARQLPALGYHRASEIEWTCGPVRLVALNADGATADLSLISDRSAVMVSNDPNAIVDWAMPETMPQAIRNRTPWFLGISTMGCNAAGLKRLPRDQRQGWYGHVGSMVNGLPQYHDLYLAAIERDASQWAYLVTSPNANNGCDWRGETEKAAGNSFGIHGMRLRSAWWRTAAEDFRGICHELFLTQDERATG